MCLCVELMYEQLCFALEEELGPQACEARAASQPLPPFSLIFESLPKLSRLASNLDLPAFYTGPGYSLHFNFTRAVSQFAELFSQSQPSEAM